MNGSQGEEGFPLREAVEDCGGRLRAFEISCDETPLGYLLRAVEVGQRGLGYEFSAFSETSPYGALGRLRQKMRAGLACRHLSGSPGGYMLTHDRLRGRITMDEAGDLVLVVDGRPIGIDDLAAILASYEGWDIELHIRDACE